MVLKQVKIGVFGVGGRGTAFFDNIRDNGGVVTAICDKSEIALAKAKLSLKNKNIATFTDFDEFIEKADIEAVFLCNFFHEHAPYAIRALEKGIHVLSECVSNGTMADGVALVRAAEKSKAIYMLAENYPFMKFNQEMYRVYRGGSLGKALYCEGEYNHPIDPANDKQIKALRPYEKHWRNYLPRTYYITHSLAPLMYITGAFPVRVTAMPVYCPEEPDSLMGYRVGDRAAIITCLNDDNSVYRITGCSAFGYHESSYRICATKGQIENARGTRGKISLNYNKWDKPEGMDAENLYMPDWQDEDKELIEKSGHGGGDFLVMREFLNCVREGKRPVFDEYFATTTASVGILAHRSLLERGVPYDIPDFHKEEDRIKYENDRLSPFWGSDGSAPTVRCCSDESYTPKQQIVDNYSRILRETEI